MLTRILLALTLGLFAAPAIAGPARAACDRPPLLAMTYNIRLDTPADGDDAWPHRRDFLIGQIATMRPELLGLQEVLPHQKRELETALPDYIVLGVGRDDGREQGEFAPLAIDRRQFRVTEHGTFWLSPTPDVPSLGWDGAFKRMVTWARISRRFGGSHLLVLNTHWDHVGTVARMHSGAMMLEWIARNRRKGEEVVVLGDFNAGADEPSVQQLTAGSAQGAALVDAKTASAMGSFGPRISFNGFDPFPREGKLIDHVFTSPTIAVRVHGVIAQHENGRAASDHFPVVALLDPQQGNGGRCRRSPK